MNKNEIMKFCPVLLFCGLLLASCNHFKPKPVSNDLSKTTVTINGKNDSVLNNRKKNYTNATVAEPCVKCFLVFVKHTDAYKKAIQGVNIHDIIFTVDWVTSQTPKQINGDEVSSGMQVGVYQKTGGKKSNLCTYVFNNASSQLYLLNKDVIYQASTLPVDSTTMKKIRNSCFWGIASGK